jgi:hypothetical protein
MGAVDGLVNAFVTPHLHWTAVAPRAAATIGVVPVPEEVGKAHGGQGCSSCCPRWPRADPARLTAWPPDRNATGTGWYLGGPTRRPPGPRAAGSHTPPGRPAAEHARFGGETDQAS